MILAEVQEAAVETGLLLSLMAAAEEAGDVLASRGHSAPAAQHQMQQKSYGAARSSRTTLSNLSNLCRARVAHRAQQSGAENGPRHTECLQQHTARYQLHRALLLLQHLMLDSAVAQVCSLRVKIRNLTVCHHWDILMGSHC